MQYEMFVVYNRKKEGGKKERITINRKYQSFPFHSHFKGIFINDFNKQSFQIDLYISKYIMIQRIIKQ